MPSKKNRMTIHRQEKLAILDLGEMEIWDGADLALLRETLQQVIEVEKYPRVGIDMRYVKYIPSGFFGMLYDWKEKGIAISAYSPQENVKNMLWFRQFFEETGQGWFNLLREPKQEYVPEVEPWDDDGDWHTLSEQQSFSAGNHNQ